MAITPQKEATPPRQKLPKNFKLSNNFKGAWFLGMKKEDQRMMMMAQHIGDIRAHNTSKRDSESYAESQQNRNVGREKS